MVGQSHDMSEALRTKASRIPCHTTTVMKMPIMHEKTTQQKIPQKWTTSWKILTLHF